MTAIDDAVTANAAYAASNNQAGVPVPPSKQLAVVACMDARLDVASFLGFKPGDAHVIRNAGGEVTDDTIRSLIISQRLLGTTSIMLVHHAGCGMLSFTDDEVAAQIEAETGSRPPFPLGAFSDLDGDVRDSIERLRANPFLPHTDDIRGFVYDVDTGALREVV